MLGMNSAATEPVPNMKITSDSPPRSSRPVPENSARKNLMRYFRYLALFLSIESLMAVCLDFAPAFKAGIERRRRFGVSAVGGAQVIPSGPLVNDLSLDVEDGEYD
jgi:hypothetical protein